MPDYCSKCGARLIYGSSFCLACGIEAELPIMTAGKRIIIETVERSLSYDGERFSVTGRLAPDPDYVAGGVISGSHSHTIIFDELAAVEHDELVKIFSPPEYEDDFRVKPPPGKFVHLDGGTLDIGITRLTDDGDLPEDTVTEEELAECYRALEIADEDPDEDVDTDRRVPTSERGAGRTTLMLMDAAERDRAGLKVVVVMLDQREIRHVLENPIVRGWGLRPSHFIGVESADPILRGYKRSSVFVDHHVWEAASASDLGQLQYLLACLQD